MLGFGITICFELKNGKKVIFDGSGFEEAVVNYFLDWPCVSVSPKQLAMAGSVEALTDLLTEHVVDGDRLVFEASYPIESEVVADTFDAYDFITMIKENVSDMSDISGVFVEMKEYNAMHFYRKYHYDTQTGAYTGIELGTPEGAEDYFGEPMDQGILSLSDLDGCEIVEREEFYSESGPDDAFYGFVGCCVE